MPNRFYVALDYIGLPWNLYDSNFPEREAVMAITPASATGIATLRLNEVIDRTGLSKSNIYDRLNPKSPRYDPTFPRQVKLGPSAVGWFESQIEAWLVSRANSDGTLSPRVVPPTTVEASSSLGRLEIERGTLKADQDLFAMRVETVRKFLEKRAKSATLVRYSELMEQTMLSKDDSDDWEILDKILSNISRDSYAENKVLLAAHVRNNNEPSDFPRQNFFDLANELGLRCDNKDAFLEQQIKNLFGHYSSPKFRTDKKLQWATYAKNCMAIILD